MRRLALVFALAILSAPLPAEAEQARKVYGIGWLLPGPSSGADAFLEHFRTALHERGYAEGRDFAIEFRGANRDVGRYPELAAELVRVKVDVIVTAGGPASLAAARNATKSIPIVMVAASFDPVGTGIIASYARPGGNVTGLTAAPEELGGKQLQLLKEAVPRLTQVGVLRDGTIGPFGGWSTETATAAEQLGVKLVVLEVRTPEELEGAFERAMRERVGALVVRSTPLFNGQRTRIAELALRRRLPAISSWRYWAEAGLLMAYGASIEDQFRRAAIYVDKILKGAKPADLPVEQPTKFALVVNLKTAKTLGVTIPPSVLARADDVIQ